MKRLLPFLLLSFLWAPAGHAALEFTVSGGEVGAKPIAIAPFATPADINFDVAAIVEADLVRSGLFDALPRADRQAIRELFLVGGSSFNSAILNQPEKSRRVELRLEFKDAGRCDSGAGSGSDCATTPAPIPWDDDTQCPVAAR